MRRNTRSCLPHPLSGLLFLLAAAWLWVLDAAVFPAAQAASSRQNQLPPSAAIRFEHLSIDQVLSQSTVTAILQDRYGFMWFGTDDGLNRYDGYEFKVFRHDPDNPASLSQGGIRALYEDGDGALWIRTSSGGFDRYDRDRGQFVHYHLVAGGIGTRRDMGPCAPGARSGRNREADALDGRGGAPVRPRADHGSRQDRGAGHS